MVGVRAGSSGGPVHQVMASSEPGQGEEPKLLNPWECMALTLGHGVGPFPVALSFQTISHRKLTHASSSLRDWDFFFRRTKSTQGRWVSGPLGHSRMLSGLSPFSLLLCSPSPPLSSSGRSSPQLLNLPRYNFSPPGRGLLSPF